MKLKPPFRKHVLKIDPKASEFKPKWVYFQCVNCVANIAFERTVLKLMLVEDDDRLNRSAMGSWRLCRGR